MIPIEALVMRTSLDWKTRRGEKDPQACKDPLKVGVQRLGWERHNGLYVVPGYAVRPDGSDHPHRRKPLLTQFPNPDDVPVQTVTAGDYPIAQQSGGADEDPNEASAAFLLATCRAPCIHDVVRTESCNATIDGNPVKGTVIRTFRFREFQDDPKDPYRVYLKPVMRDPNNAVNSFGVPVTGDLHPLWDQSTVFCPNVPAPELPEIPDPPVVDTMPATTCKQHWGHLHRVCPDNHLSRGAARG